MTDKGLVYDLWTALFGKAQSTSMNPTDRLLGGVKPLISAPVGDPYERSYDQIISIQQKGSRGFQTYDITPFNLSVEDYPCTLTADILGELFGYESGYLGRFGFAADSDTSPFWRTVGITANATWIKIEYLPSRMNDAYRSIALAPGAPDFTGPVIVGQNGGPTFPPDPRTGVDTIYPNETGRYAMDAQILLQFDDNATAPLIAKHGDVFKIPFNNVYITFKQWSPRIRVTVGFNTEIIAQDDREQMTKPAFGGGRGLLNNPSVHYVPFSITSGDITGADFDAVTPSGAGTTRYVLIDNSLPNLAAFANARTYNHGNALLWVSSLNASIYSDTNPGRISAAMALIVLDVTNQKLRRICQIQGESFVDGANNRPVLNMSRTWNEMVRVNLNWTERLALEVFISTAGTPYLRFSFEGYTYGTLSGEPNPVTGITLTPFRPTIQLSENPYIMDNFYIQNPGSNS